MAYNDLSNSTTTDFSNAVSDFIVNSKNLDYANKSNDETYYYFENAAKDMGYYWEIPEVNSAANALATWTVGRGWQASDTALKVEIENLTGAGMDTFNTLVWNHLVTMVIVGDAFMEVIRRDGIVVNLIPISPERVRLVFNGARLKRYDIWDGKEWKAKDKQDIFHTSNNRIGDNMYGQSQLNAARWLIDARNEALVDNRKILHRGMALGIAYYTTNNAGKIAFANTQIEKAVKNGEMLGLPKDTAEIQPFPTKDTSDRLESIRYYENFFYQVFGVNRSIATSDGTSEVGGKMGHVIFEVQYMRRKVELEAAFWSKLGWKITFDEQPSLAGLQQDTLAKNSGQINIQPNDTTASLTRE